ncbi:MAG: lamin tail domain-containing protein [Candidatus Marinimicrobia bacterium]|nr:lamin tail domain-containing protein [Candidatus Neomarinimicrobiota bacterium]
MKKLVIILLLVSANTNAIQANTLIAPDDSLIAYDGVFYVDRHSNVAIFHRITEAVINDPGSDFIAETARTQAGIIIRFRTSSNMIIASFVEMGGESRGMDFGVYQDGVWYDNFTTNTFEITSNNSSQLTTYEIVLPSFHNVGFTGLELDDNQALEEIIPVDKPRYVAIGNSVSHGVGQGLASYRTFPFILAEQAGWELFNLAISAARISPPIGGMFPDTDIDVITIFQGYNDWNRIHDLDQFIANYQEQINNIRESHATTTIYCITPFTTKTVGVMGSFYSMGDYQQAIRNIIDLYQANGDTNIFLIEGSHLIAHNDLADYVHLNIGGASRVAGRLYDIMSDQEAYMPPPQEIVINEILCDPDITVGWGDANGDGIRDAWQDEFIELLNISDYPVNLTGWEIGDDEDINFQFPNSYLLYPDEFVVIFGGGDVSTVIGYDANPLLTKVFSAGGFVGNGLYNSRDYLIVKSDDGLHDIYLAYGAVDNVTMPVSAVVDNITWEFYNSTAAIPDNDNSLTRSPDGNNSIEDPFVEHLTLSEAHFSPGTTVDGQEMVGIDKSRMALTPTKTQLYPNFPNPFNPQTTIRYELSETAPIEITIYDIKGQKINSLIHGEQPPGVYNIQWSGKTDLGKQVSTGVYFAHFKTKDASQIIKMTYLK